MRILVTGSRNFTDENLMRQVLAEIPSSSVTLVHGGARGADELAGKVAGQLGMKVEVHPADWNAHGKAAGPIRNQSMVDAGADLCLAFPMEASRGTWDCVRRARAAGIPVRVIGFPAAAADRKGGTE